MNQPLFRGIVQRVMEYVRLWDFFKMRLTCKMWADVSYKNQNQWFKWLQFYGKRDRLIYTNTITGEVTNCAPSDYRSYMPNESLYIVPKVLKTKPLYVQCFLIATRKRLKRFKQNWESNENMKESFHENFLWAWEKADWWHERFIEATSDLEALSNVPRKRIRLNISKP